MMKVLLISVLLAIATTVTMGGVLNDVSYSNANGVRETELDTKIRTDEYSETHGNDAEKEDGGSSESSSEEHDGKNNGEKEEEDDGNTKVALQTCPSFATYTPVAVPKPTHRPYTQPSPYVKPTYTPATNYNKPTYEQVAAPTYRPIVTTETPKPTTAYNIYYVKPEAPASVEAPKYDKPAATNIEVTTAKYLPISFEKPVASPTFTIRKSGWVRAPGYKLGYARAESSNSALIELPNYTPPVKSSDPVSVVVTTETDEKPSASRQTYPKWFFKPKSAGN